jgi:general secretion pathway protein H
MIDRSQSLHSAAAGFTLLEMLIVVALLALATAVAMPTFMRPSDGVQLQATTRKLVNALRLTRAMAIARNAEIALTIDVDKRTFSSAAIRPQSFSPDMAAELTFAEPERTTRSTGGFRFFPDGSSSGGDVRLRLHGREARICVNWLTGEAQLGQHCNGN